ncbi:MAG: hypothetical protein Q4G69_03485 [Planctomycetia bacterium]|nr:hypothetical protein [Planctomycetia bacterium]
MVRKNKHHPVSVSGEENAVQIPNLNKAEFLKTLRSKMGIISLACSSSGISPEIVDQWIRQDPEFQRKVDLCNEAALDFVESRMFEKIHEGDSRLIRFFLETRGKKRGYVPKKEIEAVSSSPIILTMEEAMILKSSINEAESQAPSGDH